MGRHLGGPARDLAEALPRGGAMAPAASPTGPRPARDPRPRLAPGAPRRAAPPRAGAGRPVWGGVAGPRGRCGSSPCRSPAPSPGVMAKLERHGLVRRHPGVQAVLQRTLTFAVAGGPGPERQGLVGRRPRLREPEGAVTATDAFRFVNGGTVEDDPRAGRGLHGGRERDLIAGGADTTSPPLSRAGPPAGNGVLRSPVGTHA